MHVAQFCHPAFQHGLIFISDDGERHAHRFSSDVGDAPHCGERRAFVGDLQTNLGAGSEWLLRFYLTAKQAQAAGLFAEFAFGLQVDHFDIGEERETPRAWPLRKHKCPHFDFNETVRPCTLVCPRVSYMPTSLGNWCPGWESNLSRLAGVSAAGARRRNPERA